MASAAPSPPAQESGRTGAAGRAFLTTGVVGACALGVLLGLWARPDLSERRMAPMQPAATPPPERRLQVVVNEIPGAVPLGQAPVLAEPEAGELHAPAGSPAGLMRIRAVEPLSLAPAPEPVRILKAAARAAEPAPAKGARRSDLPAVRAPEAPPPRLAKAAGKAKPAKRSQAGRDTPRTSARERDGRARADGGRAEGGRAEGGRAGAVTLPRAVREAAGARGKAQAGRKADVKTAKIRAAELAAKRENAIRQDGVREAARKAEARQLAALRKIEAAARARRRTGLRIAETETRAGGLIKASAAKTAGRGRCTAADPADALVCASPDLGAVDKQMSRAYHQAEAAGVPQAELQRQQRRWRAARTAAAREAPWAVHDVYLARIAELRDQARDAQGGY